MSYIDELIDVGTELEFIQEQARNLQKIAIDDRNDSWYELVLFYGHRWDELQAKQQTLIEQLSDREKFSLWLASKF